MGFQQIPQNTNVDPGGQEQVWWVLTVVIVAVSSLELIDPFHLKDKSKVRGDFWHDFH